MTTRLKNLEERQAKDYQQLALGLIDMNSDITDLTTQVNTLLDQAEELLGLKEGTPPAEMLDAKTVNLRTLVEAINFLRQDMEDIKAMLREQ